MEVKPVHTTGTYIDDDLDGYKTCKKNYSLVFLDGWGLVLLSARAAIPVISPCHMGTETMLKRAQLVIYWPNISVGIRELLTIGVIVRRPQGTCTLETTSPAPTAPPGMAYIAHYCLVPGKRYLGWMCPSFPGSTRLLFLPIFGSNGRICSSAEYAVSNDLAKGL
jgi:hypothetical protein